MQSFSATFCILIAIPFSSGFVTTCSKGCNAVSTGKTERVLSVDSFPLKATRREFCQGLLSKFVLFPAATGVLLNDPAIAVAATGKAESKSPTPSNAVDIQNGGLTAKDYNVVFDENKMPLGRFMKNGKATIVVNVKLDDPTTLSQIPALTELMLKYSKDGLRIVAVPTDQGYFEADISEIVRLKFYKDYGFGRFPVATVVDKMDIVGSTTVPLYRYLGTALKNPNGVGRVTLNYEKFLLDKDGVPVRRYPRKWTPKQMEADIQKVMAGETLPPLDLDDLKAEEGTPEYGKISPEDRELLGAWFSAKKEAQMSEYAFRYNTNFF